MKKLLFSIFSWVFMHMFRLRYDIHVKNLDLLDLDKKQGVLFLPNHPAQIDPIILSALLFKDFCPRPIALRALFNVFGIRFFLKCVKALPFPDFDLSSNMWKIKQVEKALEEIYKGLKNKENFLVYPAGKLKMHGSEEIGGNSFVYNLLQQHPTTQIVLVRTVGLWGSSFSRAHTGKPPIFWDVLKKGSLALIKNGIFFMPRRQVTIEFFSPKKNFFHSQTKLGFNRQLEKWYNQYGDYEGNLLTSETLTLIPLSRSSKKLPSIKEEKVEKNIKEIKVPQEKRETVIAKLAQLAECDPSQISEESHLFRDLGLDSLDLAELRAFLEERYEVELPANQTVETVLELYHALVIESKNPLKLKTFIKQASEWPSEPLRPDILIPEGKTIQEVFLKTAERMGKHIACADSRITFLSYKQFLLTAIVLAKKFSKLPSKKIGLALPSSVPCYLVIMALLLSRKVPVILNWTDGRRNLNFAKKLLELKVVISSYHFLDRAQLVDFGDLDNNLIFLEDIKQRVTFFNKCFAFFLAKKDFRVHYRHFELQKIDENDPAVILFTSGSESYPKAVPLSHKNILSNQRAAKQAIKMKKKDIFYGVLPPFHSFGLSATGLYPLLAGLRVFYSPDPTDTRAMVRDIFQKKITFICLAPSFYKNLFHMATRRHLKSVRLFISGAEKAPEDLISYIETLSGEKEWLEGYGVTECSPIVTINSPGEERKGVGKPLLGVQLCIIDPETGRKLKNEEEGEICIKGPSVFSGYLGEDAPDPFIEINQEKWYKSGDLGKIDTDGSLILSGRLKRFVKIKGEMVSLQALEAEILIGATKSGRVQVDEKIPQLVIGVSENRNSVPNLVLFTTFAVNKEEINQMLLNEGVPRVAKISKVKQLENIPVTAVGKVQFGKIDQLARQSHEEKDFS